jgi:Transcriptional regulator, AbiEi antitoxin
MPRRPDLFDKTVAYGGFGQPADVLLAQLAARQHGRVATWQLADLALTDSALRRRVQSGRLHREHHGVYAVGHPGRTDDAARCAAVLACGPRAMVCHRSLGHHLGLLDGPQPTVVDVMVPGGGRRRRSGIRLHQPRALDLGAVMVVRGVPCTTAERMLADLAADLPDAELATVVHRAQTRGFVSDERLRRELARPAAGIDRLRALVEPDGPDLREQLERDFAAFVRAGRWPAYRANVLLRTPLGKLRADAHWPAFGFAVELDSWRQHGDRDAFESDRERDIAASLIGLDVKRVTWRMLHGRPHVVRAMLDSRLG